MQINFFKDHTKIIICPLMAAATYIDENKKFRTFPLKNIEKHGCCRSLASRLHYARKMIDQIQESEKKGKKEWDLFFNTSRFNFCQRLSISPMCFGMIDSFIVKLFICGVIIEMIEYFRLGVRLFSVWRFSSLLKICASINFAQIFQVNFHVSR